MYKVILGTYPYTLDEREFETLKDIYAVYPVGSGITIFHPEKHLDHMLNWQKERLEAWQAEVIQLDMFGTVANA
jgi:hypothetical protein